jgi:hypothetical protein
MRNVNSVNSKTGQGDTPMTMQTLNDTLIALLVTVGIAVALSVAFVAVGAPFRPRYQHSTRSRPTTRASSRFANSTAAYASAASREQREGRRPKGVAPLGMRSSVGMAAPRSRWPGSPEVLAAGSSHLRLARPSNGLLERQSVAVTRHPE